MEQEKREKFLDITDEQIDAIYDTGKEANRNFIRFLIDKINSLEEQIQELKEQINKDSHNSHKPPSSDPPYKKKKKNQKKKRGKKKPGGQKGHEGNTLKMVSNPDKTEICETHECSHCGKSLKKIKASSYENRQVFDLPEEIKMIVTEYQAEIKDCPHCGKHNRADFPPGVTHKTQYGKYIKTYAVYLNNYMLIPYNRLSELFDDLFNISLSAGTLVNINQKCGELLVKTEDKIKEEIIKSDVVHFDETGININGILHWIHTAGTSVYTHYYPHENRGCEAMNTIGILPFFNGTAVHDHWKSYFKYNCLHSLCNAHHIRELTFIYEEYNQKWAKRMIDFLLEVKSVIEKTKRKKLNPELIKKFNSKYKRIIKAGLKANPPPKDRKEKKRGRKKKSKALNLLERLGNYDKCVLAFMYNFKVPFDNNQGERDLRMVKVKEKISCLFRSFDGAVTFCRIRSYISTVKKNCFNVIDAIKSIFEKYSISFIQSLNIAE